MFPAIETPRTVYHEYVELGKIVGSTFVPLLCVSIPTFVYDLTCPIPDDADEHSIARRYVMTSIPKESK